MRTHTPSIRLALAATGAYHRERKGFNLFEIIGVVLCDGCRSNFQAKWVWFYDCRVVMHKVRLSISRSDAKLRDIIFQRIGPADVFECRGAEMRMTQVF